jgi:hypothetical protein
MWCRALSVIGVFGALMISAINVHAEAWRGIVPLKSTRADVERLLGRPGEHGRYQFDKERAYIEYCGTRSMRESQSMSMHGFGGYRN